MDLFGLPVPVPSTYVLVLTVVGCINMCVALAVPSWRRPASVLAVALMAGNVFAADLPDVLRVASAALTPVLAAVCVLRLRQPLAADRAVA